MEYLNINYYNIEVKRICYFQRYREVYFVRSFVRTDV